MQTIDSDVVYSSPDIRWRPRRKRPPLAAMALFAAVVIAAGFAFLGRAGDPSTTASRAKADARVVADSPTRLRSDDEARIAAFQESAAISHLTPAAFLTPAASLAADQPQTAGTGAKPTAQLTRRQAQRPAPKSVLVATPAPPSRPATPEIIMADLPPTTPKVIMADLPPAPQVAATPSDDKPGYLGSIARGVERAPGEVQDFARAATDRVLGGIADIRVRVGL